MNMNNVKDNPASNPKVATHTSDSKKRKVMDTSNRYLQQKLLSNRTLSIIITMIDPRIDDRFATSGASTLKLATPQTTEVIMEKSRSNAQILRNPRHVSQTVRDGTTPGECNVSVRPLGVTLHF